MSLRAARLLMIVLAIFLLVGACTNPQPLPGAPTPIPTLIPATLPPQPTATTRPAALGINFPSQKPSAQTGNNLYKEEQCTSCHGVDGKGTVPGARDFSDADYLRGESPLRFFQVISDGRGSMPGFRDRLSEDERWDLTMYIWHFVAPPETLKRGEAIYERDCAVCHGADGKGVVPNAPDLTDFEEIAVHTARDYFQVVTEGKDTMPSWQARLSPDERWAAIEYLRTFAYEPTAILATATPTEAPPTLSPTKEPATITPTQAPPENDIDARAIFAQFCAGCHGAQGEGGYGPALSGLQERSVEELVQLITQGAGDMPAFEEKLDEGEIEALVLLVKELSENP